MQAQRLRRGCQTERRCKGGRTSAHKDSPPTKTQRRAPVDLPRPHPFQGSRWCPSAGTLTLPTNRRAALKHSRCGNETEEGSLFEYHPCFFIERSPLPITAQAIAGPRSFVIRRLTGEIRDDNTK